MKLFAMSILDNRADVYNTPFFSRGLGEAERNFQELCNDPKSMVNKYPDDYSLYLIGEFDDQTGKLESLKEPKHLVKAINFISRQSVQDTQNLQQ